MLSGKVSGSSRQDLLRQARASAVMFYGNDCVAVELTDEQAFNYLSTFTANYTAKIKHTVIRKTYGFDYCSECNKTFDT